ncbi:MULTISPECIES: hypothetical protein [unclassified Bradyrhizobium]|uniref:hypothetical protein n=1 Tax=unclassified Bradyrhizobium TaxID=2631580 RepID=UPI001FD9C1AF|nr:MULTISPECIES: hypothetical protein [unclassified Bradyrhizobium]
MGEIADREAGEQRARHRAKAEGADPEAADPVARRDHQEQCEFRITDEKLLQPNNHRFNIVARRGYVIIITSTMPQIVSSVFPTA